MSVNRQFVTGTNCSYWRKLFAGRPVTFTLSWCASLREYLDEEPMPIDPGHGRSVAVAMALGGIAGAAIIHSHHDQKRKSQAEKDDPEGVEWICDLVWNLLDEWEPPEYKREDDYTDDLVQFLRDELSGERGDDGRRINVIMQKSVRKRASVLRMAEWMTSGIITPLQNRGNAGAHRAEKSHPPAFGSPRDSQPAPAATGRRIEVPRPRSGLGANRECGGRKRESPA